MTVSKPRSSLFFASTLSSPAAFEAPTFPEANVLSLSASLSRSGTGRADRLFGTSGSDVLSGLGGNDLLDGRKGRDRMAGGTGNDTYIVDNAGDRVSEKAGGGTDTVKASIHWTLGAQVENLILTGRANLKGTGNSLANTLTGNSGHNTLDGKAGADRLAGGRGNDTYIVDNARDRVTEKAGEGTDTVRASVSYTLGSQVENLVLLGAAVSGRGNGLDNAITGNALANALSGEAGNDTLEGGAGNDTLDGGTGADRLVGGLGDDTYIVDNAADAVVEAAGGGSDAVSASVDYTLSDHVERLVLVGAALRGTGNAQANTIIGNADNNTLDGAGGADTLDGGAGNDVYAVDDAGDWIVEAEGGGIDTVRAAFDYTLGAHVENLVLLGSALSGTGNALDNAITGNGLANSLIGSEGNDTLDGGQGADTLEGGSGDDVYIVDHTDDTIVEAGESGSDTVRSSVDYVLGDHLEKLILIGAAVRGVGNNLDNNLIGNALANDLQGGGGNDVLDGGAGADRLEGGSGNDFYLVDDAGDEIVETEDGGYDTVHASTDYTIGDHVEWLVLVGGAIAGTGNGRNNLITGNDLGNSLSGADGDDTLEGGAGSDTLIGGLGRDSLVGGDGNDVYVIDGDTSDVIDERGGDEDIDTVRTTLRSYTLGDRIENLIIENDTESNSAIGNALANDITTGSNNDILSGGGGDDTLRGGHGNDTYFINQGDSNDVVVEEASGGRDRIYSSISYVLPDHVEELIVQSPDGSGLQGTGNDSNNTITGGIGNDTLFGGGGNDSLSGGGGGGTDSLVGGTGNDVYLVYREEDVVVELAGEGTDHVMSIAASFTLPDNVENLELVGTLGSTGYGNGLNNRLVGNGSNNLLEGRDGNDSLDGGSGSDTLTGGRGDDVYTIDNLDTLIEAIDEGTDTVRVGFSYTLRDNFENLEITGFQNIDGTGNAANNRIVGNSGHNILNGMGGTDTLIGGDGDDIYTVDSAAEVVIDTSGTDTLRAGFNFGTFNPDRSLTRTILLQDDLENLTLIGGTEVVVGLGNLGNNYIRGNAGTNVLDGVYGNDTLNGGAGDDILFGSLGATIFEYSDRVSVEKIRGFVPTEGDRIDLRPLRQAGLISSYDVGTERDPDNPSVFIYRIGTYSPSGNGKIFIQDTATTISNIHQYILF
ncbi:Ca2+-binding RTX toxin-like protein [Microvirga flocculans]|uniref:Ca2+-binding RTX toxin-like protein n=1 Tax=Microvirga flocculans TaxID=217168 RepID=A0A7W6IFQ6_9HYPH|nr:calcium-binding protein [Microvirga flocculans]MBB4040632.1 Ca2+-binding RTX toxin-like protein [Microvirga flocculans]